MSLSLCTSLEELILIEFNKATKLCVDQISDTQPDSIILNVMKSVFNAVNILAFNLLLYCTVYTVYVH
jgi:hypothetical protein